MNSLLKRNKVGEKVALAVRDQNDVMKNCVANLNLSVTAPQCGVSLAGEGLPYGYLALICGRSVECWHRRLGVGSQILFLCHTAKYSRVLAAFIVILLGASIAHAQEQQCPPNDTLCVAEVAAARLSAANAKITALTQINKDQEAIIAGKDKLIELKDQLIANMDKIDKNGQKIDTLGQETNAIWREQHNEDKHIIGDLQKDIASCRNNQKWIFGAGAVAGGVIGWKVKGNSSITNLFTNPLSTFQSPQEKAQQALKLFGTGRLQSTFTK